MAVLTGCNDARGATAAASDHDDSGTESAAPAGVGGDPREWG
jgi:hypothetical protein